MVSIGKYSILAVVLIVVVIVVATNITLSEKNLVLTTTKIITSGGSIQLGNDSISYPPVTQVMYEPGDVDDNVFVSEKYGFKVKTPSDDWIIVDDEKTLNDVLRNNPNTSISFDNSISEPAVLLYQSNSQNDSISGVSITVIQNTDKPVEDMLTDAEEVVLNTFELFVLDGILVEAMDIETYHSYDDDIAVLQYSTFLCLSDNCSFTNTIHQFYQKNGLTYMILGITASERDITKEPISEDIKYILDSMEIINFKN